MRGTARVDGESVLNSEDVTSAPMHSAKRSPKRMVRRSLSTWLPGVVSEQVKEKFFR